MIRLGKGQSCIVYKEGILEQIVSNMTPKMEVISISAVQPSEWAKTEKPNEHELEAIVICPKPLPCPLSPLVS